MKSFLKTGCITAAIAAGFLFIDMTSVQAQFRANSLSRPVVQPRQAVNGMNRGANPFLGQQGNFTRGAFPYGPYPYSAYPGMYPGGYPGTYQGGYYPGMYQGGFPGMYPGGYPGSYPGMMYPGYFGGFFGY